MAAIILFKRSDSATAPGSGILSRGEPAYTFGTGYDSNDGQRLFVGVPDGGTSRSAIVGGEYYTTKMNHTPGVLQTTLPAGTEQGTVALVDSLGVIDKWRVDNLRFGEADDNTITTSTGNLVLDAATDTIVFSGATLDSIGSLIVDSATINNLTIASGGKLTVPVLEVTDSATVVDLDVTGTATVAQATVTTLDVTDSATIEDLTVTNKATIDSAQIGSINITGTTIQSTTGSTLTINPFPVGDSGELVILGDLRVEGTTTTVNSTEVTISDKNLVLGDDATNTSDLTGGGIQIGDSSAWGSTAAPSLEWYDPDSEFRFNRNIHVIGSSGSNGNITADSADFITLDVTGTSTLEFANIDSSHTNFADIDDANIDRVVVTDSATIADATVTGTATIAQATVTTLDVTDSGTLAHADIAIADIDSADIVDAQITNLTATNASFTNISSVDSANFTTFSADSATFNILRISDSIGLKTMFDSTDFIFIDAPGSPQVALKAEAIEDFVGAMIDSVISVQTNIQVRYDDSGGAIDFEVPFATGVDNTNAGSGIAGGAGVAKFDDSDFAVTPLTGYVAINQVDGGTF